MEFLITTLVVIIFFYLITMATYAMLTESIVINNYIEYWKFVFSTPAIFIYNLILLILCILSSMEGIHLLKI